MGCPTRAEWAFVGNPDLSSLGKSVVQAERVVFPSMERNPRFVKELHAQGVTPQQPVYLIAGAACVRGKPLNCLPNAALPLTT